MMVAFVLLLVACIVFSYIGTAIKEMYDPSKKLENFLLTAFILLTLTAQLTTIYLTAPKSPFFSMIEIMAFDCYWFYFAPFHPNSDPAGNGMAWGFRSLFNTAASVLLGVISYLLIKFWAYDSRQTGLHIVLFFAACIGLINLFRNRQSFLLGDSLEESARWARMSVEDYRKTLFRAGMLEKADAWEAKELDASPEELKHWNVCGSKCIAVKTHEKLYCVLLEGSFVFPDGPADIDPSGFLCGFLGLTDDGDANDTSFFVPKHVKLVWHDLTDGKTYRVYTALPKGLDRYFDDTDRFWLDNIEFRIMPGGKVLMFHNRHNQIHNIMIDYPLQGEETNDYEQKLSDLISEKEIDVNAYRAAKAPSLDTIHDYLKRFRYHPVFRTENDSLKITKTICNFFNGEKILSDGAWRENMNPTRIKDVFIRFESEQQRYAAFIYFNEDEVSETFGEAFHQCDESLTGELMIQVGTSENGFSVALKLGVKCCSLKATEIRLYKMDADDAGKLIFKNYKGNHKNLLTGLAVLCANV